MESSKLGLCFEDFEIGAEIKHNLSKTIFECDNNFFFTHDNEPSPCAYQY